MSAPVRLAVAGAGLIGRRHIAAIAAAPGARLVCVADPAPEAVAVAAEAAAAWHPSLDALIAAGGIDGVILATPNALHVDGALACIAAGLPVLVEKPLAADVAGGRRIAEAATAAGVPVLVGHHRRHNPIVARAREVVASGALGRVVAVHATMWVRKHDAYFETGWRRGPGAGPVFINLIHDLDLLRYFAGPIDSVFAYESTAARGHEVEDTAAIALRFAGGALGTVGLSDAVAAPWSWELTAGENPAYAETGQSAYLVGGTEASLSVPDLRLWRHEGAPSWWAPMEATRIETQPADPLVRQVMHFAEVIATGAPPLVGVAEGLAALAAVEAVKRSGATGLPVRPADLG